MAADRIAGDYVRVLYDYDYDGNHGPVSIKTGDEYLLLRKTNEEWWCVFNTNLGKPIYVPSNYVEIIEHNAKPLPALPQKPKRVQEEIYSNLQDLADIREENDAISVLDEVLNQSNVDEICDDADKRLSNGINYDKDETLSMDQLPAVHAMEKATKTSRDENKNYKDTKSESSLSSESHSKESLISGDSLADVLEPFLQSTAESHSPVLLAKSKESEPVNYANLADIQAHITPSPPKPPAGSGPVKVLEQGWEVHTCGLSGRQYYYNNATRESTWKPPRPGNRSRESSTSQASTSSEQLASDESEFAPPPNITASLEQLTASFWEKSTSFCDASSGGDSPRPRLNTFGTQVALNGIRRPGAPQASKRLSAPESSAVPSGWREEQQNGQAVFVSDYTNEKWHPAVDDTGRQYYFQAGSHQSTWILPEVGGDSVRLSAIHEKPTHSPKAASLPRGLGLVHGKLTPPVTMVIKAEGDTQETVPETDDIAVEGATSERLSYPIRTTRLASAPSLDRSADDVEGVDWRCLQPAHFSQSFSSPSTPDMQLPLVGAPFFPRKYSLGRKEKRGYLNKTKIMENGKKIKKSWQQCFIVMRGSELYFYRDEKAATPKASQPLGKHEPVLNLEGASVEFGGADKQGFGGSIPKTSKKNVIQVKLKNGTELLLQTDDHIKIHDWYITLSHNAMENPNDDEEDSVSENNKKGLDSQSSVDKLSANEKNVRIFERLSNFFKKRPTKEYLQEKGIYREAVFGSTLQKLYDKDKCYVPKFVSECITAIEKDCLTQDGIYRVPGNLAQIQKLRFMVDHAEEYDLEDEAWDAHVLAGLLKLFFRELSEPLFTFPLYSKFLKSAQHSDRSKKLKAVKECIKDLPKPNRETLKELMRHLRRVCEHSKDNRMLPQNIAIVFGPTLLWTQDMAANLAVNIVIQGQLVELLLLEPTLTN